MISIFNPFELFGFLSVFIFNFGINWENWRKFPCQFRRVNATFAHDGFNDKVNVMLLSPKILMFVIYIALHWEVNSENYTIRSHTTFKVKLDPNVVGEKIG